VLTLNRTGTAGAQRLFPQLLELIETLLDGMRDGRQRPARATLALDLRIFYSHARLLLAPSQAYLRRR
jgi:hypothetical protein